MRPRVTSGVYNGVYSNEHGQFTARRRLSRDPSHFVHQIPGLYTWIDYSAKLYWSHMFSANGGSNLNTYSGTWTTVTLYSILCVREQPRQTMALSSSG